MNRLMPFFLLGVAMSSCGSKQPYPLTDHYDGEHFFNPDKRNAKTFIDVLKWYVKETSVPWPDSVPVSKEAPKLSQVAKQEIHITFINHATVLIRSHTAVILTDPVFSMRTSPVSWAGPKRIQPPGVAITDLPRIDVIVISHNHYDHMDLPSLEILCKRDKPTVIVPLGNAEILKDLPCKGIVELDWWHTYDYSDDLRITSTPARHWSGRGLFDRLKALWSGFYLDFRGSKIFFAGDTGYGAHFRSITDQLGAPDLALLPIGAYEPRWFMKDNHMNPEDAVQAHLDLGAAQSMPIHYGTFRLSNEGWDDPLKSLETALNVKSLSPTVFRATKEGHSLVLNRR